MQLRKDSPLVSVIDAVDLLSDMAEWNQNIPLDKKLSTDQKLLKEVFISVLHYMQALASRHQLKDSSVRHGLHAVMALAREAVVQIEKIQGDGTVSSLQEVKSLELFYQQKISPHIPKEIRELETGNKVEGESAGVDVLQDIEKVRFDEAYELFLIRKEDGQGYFTRTLLNHIQLVSRFDALVLHLSEEDPFTRIKILSDRDCHEGAKEILKAAAPLIDAYYKEALKFKQLGFVSLINRALMALMLAGNSRNLISNTTGKSSFKYYQDFHNYLRSAFTSVEYNKLRTVKSERSEHFLHTVMLLSTELCSQFFLRVSSKVEQISFIHSAIKLGEKGAVTRSAKGSPLSFWNRLLDQDASLRFYFKQYPSAPLIKVSQLIDREELMGGFDPFSQGIYPNLLYTLNSKSLDVSIMRLPAPIRQETIDKALPVGEFQAWIQSMKNQGHHHLLINLQDRTSWKEHARSRCLEKEQDPDLLTVVTFDKNTEFYQQSGPYVQWDDAVEFMKLCKDQLLSEHSGFYLPAEAKGKDLINFIDPALNAIHTHCFGGKARLTEQNRLNFIDLFYLFLTLKLIEILKVDSLSFVCKDGVDLGAVMEGQFFAFMKMMNGSTSWEKKDADLLLWMLHTPALGARGRVVNHQRLCRMISSLEAINGALDTEGASLIKGCSKLYSTPFFKDLKMTGF